MMKQKSSVDVPLLDLQLSLDRGNIVRITLQYQSLSDLIAFLGGLSKGLGLLLFVLVFPIREIQYYRKLINSMFSVCMTPNQINTALSLITEEITGNKVLPETPTEPPNSKKSVELRRIVDEKAIEKPKSSIFSKFRVFAAKRTSITPQEEKKISRQELKDEEKLASKNELKIDEFKGRSDRRFKEINQHRVITYEEIENLMSQKSAKNIQQNGMLGSIMDSFNSSRKIQNSNPKKKIVTIVLDESQGNFLNGEIEDKFNRFLKTMEASNKNAIKNREALKSNFTQNEAIIEEEFVASSDQEKILEEDFVSDEKNEKDSPDKLHKQTLGSMGAFEDDAMNLKSQRLRSLPGLDTSLDHGTNKFQNLNPPGTNEEATNSRPDRGQKNIERKISENIVSVDSDCRIVGIADQGILDSNLNLLKKTYRSITVPRPSSEESFEHHQGVRFNGVLNRISIEEDLEKEQKKQTGSNQISREEPAKLVLRNNSKNASNLDSSVGSKKLIEIRKNLLELEQKKRPKPSDGGGGGDMVQQPKNTFNIAKLNIKLQKPGDMASLGQEIENAAVRSRPETPKLDFLKSSSDSFEDKKPSDNNKSTINTKPPQKNSANQLTQESYFGKVSGEDGDSKMAQVGKKNSIFEQLGGKLKLLGKGIKDGLCEVADKTLDVFSPRSSRRKIARVMDASPRRESTFEDKIEEIKKQNQKRERQSKTLTFMLSIFDYVKLWVPRFMSNYSKLRLYNQVNIEDMFEFLGGGNDSQQA